MAGICCEGKALVRVIPIAGDRHVQGCAEREERTERFNNRRAVRELVRRLEGTMINEQRPHQKESQILRVPLEPFGKNTSCNVVRGLGA